MVPETVPVVDHPKLAEVEVVEAPGPEVIVTVGALPVGVEDVIVQLYVAERLPNELPTVTVKVWAPAARPE